MSFPRLSLFPVVCILASAGIAGPADYYGKSQASTNTKQRGPVTRAEVEKLRQVMKTVGQAVDDLQKDVEEWGSLNLSAVVFAAPEYTGPDGKRKTPFDFDLEKTAHAWFEEAGKTEGIADFGERIFHTLTIAGTLKSTPEDALTYETHLNKIRTQQKLYDAQLRKFQVQEEDRLEDYTRQREDAEKARQMKLKAGKEKLDSATVETREAQIILDKKNAGATSALAALRTKQAAFDEANRELQIKPEDPTAQARARAAQAERDEAQSNYDRAKTDADTAAAELETRKGKEKIARDEHTVALSEAPSSPTLLKDGDITIPKDPITSGTYTAPTADEAGDSLTKLKTALSNIPTATPTDISTLGNENVFGRSLRPKTDEGVFPARSRLIEAAGNKTMQEIFNFLGDPAAALVFKDKLILYGVATVAANPGWRTYVDYDGQLDVQTKYAWKPARRETVEAIVLHPELFPKNVLPVAKSFLETGRWPIQAQVTPSEPTLRDGYKTIVDADKEGETFDAPLVAAVSPLMERQAMDLTSSRARQDEVAVFLSAALAKSGFKGQAEVFDKYIKLRRQDVATRSVLPVLNAFNLGGGVFGFQFGPRLDALDQPGAKNPKPARQLGKQSFPVLLMFSMPKEDIRPRLVETKLGTEKHLMIQERGIVLEQTTRWSRQRKRGSFHSGIRSVFAPGFPGRPMQAPSEEYERLYSVNMAMTQITATMERFERYDNFEALKAMKRKVEADLNVLRMNSFGGGTMVSIPVDYLVAALPPPPPAPVAPAVISVFPRSLQVGRATEKGGDDWAAELVIVGQGLDQVYKEGITTEPGGFGSVKILTPVIKNLPGKQAMALRVHFAPSSNGQFQIRLPIKPAGKDTVEEKDKENLVPVFTPIIAVTPSEPRPSLDPVRDSVLIPRKVFTQAPESKDGSKTKTLFVDLRYRKREIATPDALKTSVRVSPETIKAQVVELVPSSSAHDEISLVLELTVPTNFGEKAQNASVTLTSEVITWAGVEEKRRTIQTQPITIQVEP